MAGDPNIVGKTVWLNSKPFVVIGVTAPDFVGLGLQKLGVKDLWLPMMMRSEVSPQDQKWLDKRDDWLRISGRLKPGRTSEEASAEMTLLYGQLQPAGSKINPNTIVSVRPLYLIPSVFWRLDGHARRHVGDRNGAADRLLQHRQPDARAGGQAAARDRRAIVPGREPQSSGPAVVDREPVTRRPGRRRRLAIGMVESQSLPDISLTLPSAVGSFRGRDNELPQSGRVGFDLYVDSFAARRAGLRFAARPARDANRPGFDAQGRRGRVRRTTDALATAQRAGGGAGGALDDLVARIRIASAGSHSGISRKRGL